MVDPLCVRLIFGFPIPYLAVPSSPSVLLFHLKESLLLHGRTEGILRFGEDFPVCSYRRADVL